jgi:hypothetical protein
VVATAGQDAVKLEPRVVDPSGRLIPGHVEEPLNGLNEALRALLVSIAEQVRALQRSQGPATADVPVRDVAVVEPDRDKPGRAGAAAPQFLDCR